MTSPVRFAVIGCGAMAMGTHLPNIHGSRQAALHTCCDLSEETLQECGRRFGPVRLTRSYAEAVADPEVDAICLATTERLRLPVIELAAAAGKPVYVEKPLARSLEEMYRIQEVVHGAGIPLCVGHNRRCSPALSTARLLFRAHMDDPQPCPWRWDREGPERPRLAEDGVPSVAVRINDDWYSWKAWVFDREQAPHGPMLFEMSHFTDICSWMLAAQPVEVMAMESGMLNHGVLVRYDSGAVATISMCANGSWGYPKELYEAMGNGGMVAAQDFVELLTAGLRGVNERLIFPLAQDPCPEVGTEGGLSGWLAKRRWAGGEAERSGDPTRILSVGVDKGHARAIDAFVDEIRGAGPTVCGIDDAITATRICFAAVRSAQEHRPVRLEEV